MEHNMRICDLRQKEVINVRDGERMGYVEDIEFDLCSGCICSIIVPGPCKLWGILGKEEEYVICLNDIQQVGSDVILVNVNREKIRKKYEKNFTNF